MNELGYVCYLLEDGCPTIRLTDFPVDIGLDLVSCIFEWRGGGSDGSCFKGFFK